MSQQLMLPIYNPLFSIFDERNAPTGSTSSSSPVVDRPRCRLLELPAELRTQIYSELLTPESLEIYSVREARHRNHNTDITVREGVNDAGTAFFGCPTDGVDDIDSAILRTNRFTTKLRI